MKALVFDTETTGLISNRTVHLDKQPHCIQFYGAIADLESGEIIEEVHSFVKPSQPYDLSKPVKGTRSIFDMTNISNEMVKDAPLFREIAPSVIKLIEKAPAIIAHNLSFDKDMVEVELERIKQNVVWPKDQICTVEQTIHLRGHRLNLSRLHDHLFPGETFTAHRADTDSKALIRICVELHKRGVI